MTAGELIALIAGGAAVVAAVIAVFQARAARAAANEAARGADAAEEQATAVREQADLMKEAAARDAKREQEEEERSKVAAVEVWRETRQPRGGAGAVVVIENAGPAIAIDLVVEVVAAGDGDTAVLATDDHRIDRRAELRQGEQWLIPLMQDVKPKRMPIECFLRWTDQRTLPQEARCRVESIGRAVIDVG